MAQALEDVQQQLVRERLDAHGCLGSPAACVQQASKAAAVVGRASRRRGESNSGADRGMPHAGHSPSAAAPLQHKQPHAAILPALLK